MTSATAVAIARRAGAGRAARVVGQVAGPVDRVVARPAAREDVTGSVSGRDRIVRGNATTGRRETGGPGRGARDRRRGGHTGNVAIGRAAIGRVAARDQSDHGSPVIVVPMIDLDRSPSEAVAAVGLIVLAGRRASGQQDRAGRRMRAAARWIEGAISRTAVTRPPRALFARPTNNAPRRPHRHAPPTRTCWPRQRNSLPAGAR